MATAKTARLRVRSSSPRDARPISRVHVLTWKEAYPGHVDQDYLDGLDATEHESGWYERLCDPAIQCELATHGAEVVGFVCWGASRDADDDGERVGEIQSLYVHPDWWGCGVGHLLFARARTRLRRLGCTELTTWALVGHSQSIDFYRGHGMCADGPERVDHPSEGVRLPLFRMRTRIDEDQPWLTWETFQRAALHCGLAGVMVGGISTVSGNFTGTSWEESALFGLAGGCALLPLHLLRAKRLSSVGGDRRPILYGVLAFWLALASTLLASLWAVFMSDSLSGGHAAALTELADGVLGTGSESLQDLVREAYIVAVLCSPWAIALAFGTNRLRSVLGTWLAAITLYAWFPLTQVHGASISDLIALLALMLIGSSFGVFMAGLRVLAELPWTYVRVSLLGRVEREWPRRGPQPGNETGSATDEARRG